MSTVANRVMPGLFCLWAALLTASSFQIAILPPWLAMFGPTIAMTGLALLHCHRTYGARGAILFFAIAVIISNIYENLSIATGFPFGKYHHLGWAQTLFSVPWPVGLFFFNLTYVALRLAVSLTDVEVGTSGRIARFGLPPVAAFIVTGWDICYDPLLSHFHSAVIYERGGGFFGVPLSNYAGWFLCCWTIFQIFTLSIRSSDVSKASSAMDRYGPALVWAIYAVQIDIFWLIAPPIEKADAAGRLWQLRDFLDSAVFLSFYTMIFVAFTAALLAHRRR